MEKMGVEKVMSETRKLVGNRSDSRSEKSVAKSMMKSITRSVTQSREKLVRKWGIYSHLVRTVLWWFLAVEA